MIKTPPQLSNMCMMTMSLMCSCVFIGKDYDDLEFSIVSLDGRQWLFEATTLEVSCSRLHYC